MKGAAAVAAAALLASVCYAFPLSAAGLNGDPAYTEGPQVCGNCHEQAFEDWLSHGHSRILGIGGPVLRAIDGRFGLFGNARDGGFRLPDDYPATYNWDNVAFIVGASKRWKTRFVDRNGNIITKGGNNQYNWANGAWVDYHKDAEAPYTCGGCHTTGYRTTGTSFNEHGIRGTDLGPMPGIRGDWAQFNVTCEACHGPGAAHASRPGAGNILSDRSAQSCGACHGSAEPDQILAVGGFISHHEQYAEMVSGPHEELRCVTCHQPHAGRAHGTKVRTGNTTVCETCHREQKQSFAGSPMQQAGVTCIDCHMAKIGMSAVAAGPFEGDLRTHIVRIDPAADYKMFTPDRPVVADAIDLRFACFRCHASASQAEFAKIKDFHTVGK